MNAQLLLIVLEEHHVLTLEMQQVFSVSVLQVSLEMAEGVGLDALVSIYYYFTYNMDALLCQCRAEFEWPSTTD